MSQADFKLALIENWQRHFPLCEKPFELLATSLGTGEAEVLEALQKMQEEGVLTRVGAVVRPNTVGVSTLAAMQVPADRLQEVANIVNGEAGVNHNYEREHEFNLWFVVTSIDKTALGDTLARIARHTGFEVISLPLRKAHHIDLGFSIKKKICPTHGRREEALAFPVLEPGEHDRRLLAAIEDGLPLVSRPYHQVARQLGMRSGDLIERLKQLVEARIISRFGLVIRHRKMGYTANAMAVWDIADNRVDELGNLLASRPFVTLCYQRLRVRPYWPYNLFCMIHGHRRSDVEGQIAELNELVDEHQGHTVLFSKQCFKQRGARFSLPDTPLESPSGNQQGERQTSRSDKPAVPPLELIHV